MERKDATQTTYRQLKSELRFERYLATKDREAREAMTRLRGGTNELRIETGRCDYKQRQTARAERKEMSDLYEWRDRGRDTLCVGLFCL